jgi:hypothetical protein
VVPPDVLQHIADEVGLHVALLEVRNSLKRIGGRAWSLDGVTGMTYMERIAYSLKHHEEKTAAIFSRSDWNTLVLASGEPTRLTRPPVPLENVVDQASVVAIAASGQVNPDPGIDVVRLDGKDKPFVYNLDHYKVVENLQQHPQYDSILKTAGLTQAEDLDAALEEHVFIVGPFDKDYPGHWAEDIPVHIANAKKTQG